MKTPVTDPASSATGPLVNGSVAINKAPDDAMLMSIAFAGVAMPDTIFWFIPNQFGHRYGEVRCRQEDGEADVSHDRDLLITDEFGHHLAAA